MHSVRFGNVMTGLLTLGNDAIGEKLEFVKVNRKIHKIWSQVHRSAPYEIVVLIIRAVVFDMLKAISSIYLLFKLI